MTPTPEDIATIKKLVKKLETYYPLEIRLHGSDEAWFLRLNDHSAAGNVDFYTVLDMLRTVEFLGEIGLLKGKEN